MWDNEHAEKGNIEQIYFVDQLNQQEWYIIWCDSVCDWSMMDPVPAIRKSI